MAKSFNPEIRERILLEILNTERDYVSDLNIILDVYKEPLTQSGCITEEQSQILFANVEEVETLNRTKVLAKIEARFKAVTDAGVPSYMINMGDIFVSLAESLKMYTEYCANQPNALAMLDELERENDEFAAFTKKLMETDEVVRGLSMLSFIIKPVQRLCKYPLLLRELINNTDPTLPEHQRLKEAAEKVGETVDYVNAMQREAEQSALEKQNELQQIEASIEGADQIGLSQDKNRRIARVGDVTQITKKKVVPRKLYGFNNLLIVVAPKKKVKKGETQAFKLDFHLKIADTAVVDLGDDGLIVNGFELKHKTTGESVTLCCATLGEKNAWVKDIRAHIKEYQKQENARRKIRQVLSSPSPAPFSDQGSSNSERAMEGSIGGMSQSTPPALSSASKPRRGDSVSTGTSRPGLELAEGDIPAPPPEDGAMDWKERQDAESTDPPGFVRPPRWGDWLQYFHEEHGIPYYFNISTKETTWFTPAGWTPS